jgi:two-component system, OmpR family, sensor histidine kinase BaeS
MEDGVVRPEPETLALLRAEAARLRRLVEDVATVSRAEERQLDLRPSPVDPAALVAEAVQAARPAYETKGVALETRAVRLPRVVADADRLSEVLRNLLDNALRHTPSGGSVLASAEPSGDGVALAVEDTGEGIAPEHLPRLFERFYRADAGRARARGGSGIGLTIVRAIVEAHGGTIHAESKGIGRGARFVVALPARDRLPT